MVLASSRLAPSTTVEEVPITRHRPLRTSLLLLLLIGLALPPGVPAQWAVSSNDNKVILDNGVVKVVPNAPTPCPYRSGATRRRSSQILRPQRAVADERGDHAIRAGVRRRLRRIRDAKIVPDNRLTVVISAPRRR
jgi:hypothetical protein